MEVSEIGIEPIDFKTIEMSQIDVEVAKAEQSFGFDLFAEYSKSMSKKNSKENFVISPLSAAFDLSMLANTTQSRTYESIMQTLGYENIEDLNTYNSKLLEYLPVYNNDMKLALANNVWFDSKHSAPSNEYVAKMKDIFKCNPLILDFKKQSSVDAVNSWVNSNTYGLIDEIIKSFYDNPVCLANALYFNSPWDKQFDESYTKRKQFIGVNGEVTASMMSGTRTAEYCEIDGVKMVKLPLKNSRVAMYFVLPPASVDVREYASQFSQTMFTDFTAGLQSKKVSISLPKFKIEHKTTLDEELASMGVDKTKMQINSNVISEAPSFSTNTVHSVSIELTERGVEAGAVTLEVLYTGGYEVPEEFIANHPFIYFLVEEKTGSLLMAGAVLDPSR